MYNDRQWSKSKVRKFVFNFSCRFGVMKENLREGGFRPHPGINLLQLEILLQILSQIVLKMMESCDLIHAHFNTITYSNKNEVNILNLMQKATNLKKK